MKNGIGAGALGALLIGVIFLVMNALFVVDQREAAIVLRFGSPIPGRGVIQNDPGLHWKVPFIESVTRIDARILDLESPKQEVLAADNQRIEVDAFVRYKVSDPLRFFQSVSGSVQRANNQLTTILNSALRGVLGTATQAAVVRDNREQLMQAITKQVAENAKAIGVEVVDVRIRRADLPREISEGVYRRMQTERQREAAEFRAQGAEQAARITAKADADVTVLRAEAQKKSDLIRGEGEAERNRTFAEAFSKDPDFFVFWRSMLSYEATLKAGDTRMVLSPDSEFFRYLRNPSGVDRPAKAAPAN
jgi:membrane protease subunit HflC